LCNSPKICGCQGNYIRFPNIVACPENIFIRKKCVFPKNDADVKKTLCPFQKFVSCGENNEPYTEIVMASEEIFLDI
jgi:hypothetical protein